MKKSTMEQHDWDVHSFIAKTVVFCGEYTEPNVGYFIHLAFHDLLVNDMVPLERSRWANLWEEMLFEDFLPVADSLLCLDTQFTS